MQAYTNFLWMAFSLLFGCAVMIPAGVAIGEWVYNTVSRKLNKD